MTGEDSLTGRLNEVGGAATPSPGSTRPGYAGVLGNVVNGTGGLIGPDAIRQLVNPGENTQAPQLEVDPAVLRDTIKVYNNELETLIETFTQCQVVEAVQAPADEFASNDYAAKHKPIADSLRQSIQSTIDRLTRRRDKLQASLDSYLHTESTNAHDLRREGR